MSKKALESIAEKAKERAITQGQQHLHEEGGIAWMREMIERVGAAKATDMLSKILDAATIRQWEEFQQQRGYMAYDCETFDQFLDQYRPNGLNKNNYYRRKELLAAEGDDLFDKLNELHVPATQRKLLGAGSIQIEGDILRIGEQTAPISDPKQVKRLFKEVAEAFELAQDTHDKEQKKLEKIMKRAGFTFEKDDEGKVKIIPPEAQAPVILGRHDETDPANAAYMRVLSSLAELTRALNDLPGEEADKRLNELYRPAISSAVEMCFAFSASTATTRAPDKLREATAGLSEADIEDLLDDE